MRFDMHCHTKAGSIDAVIPIDKYITLLKEQGFDGMLVTDHDSYRGYQYWKEHQDEMPSFTVLRGVEYDTRDAGHFIVIMPEGVQLKLLNTRGMSVETLIRVVHGGGGVLGPAHPFGAKSSSAMLFRKMKKNPDIAKDFDFVEGLNVCEKVIANRLAQKMAVQYGLQCFGGSDSHKPDYVGMAYTDFPDDVTDNDSLIACIKEKRILDFGGRERTFKRSHNKRNHFYATWGFRAYNTGLGLLYTPLRQYRLNQLAVK